MTIRKKSKCDHIWMRIKSDRSDKEKFRCLYCGEVKYVEVKNETIRSQTST